MPIVKYIALALRSTLGDCICKPEPFQAGAVCEQRVPTVYLGISGLH